MGELLTCPVDGTPLVMAADHGVYETACHQCRREFRFTHGVLKALDRGKSNDSHHAIALRVHAEHESVEVEDTVFAARWADIPRETVVTLTQQLDRERRTRLVRIERGGKAPLVPSEPGDHALLLAFGTLLRGALVVGFATILATYFYHLGWLLLLPAGAVAVIALAGWRWRRSSTKQDIDAAKLKRLQREQWLLAQLQRYRLKSADVDARLRQQTRQIAEMQALANDMARAPGDYAHRLEVVRRGIAALEEYRSNDERLKKALANAMTIVEIEYRAARALDGLPDDAIDRLSATIAELAAIEEENVTLEALLEANAEVHSIAPG